MPGSMQAWAKVAEFWSPADAPMGTVSPKNSFGSVSTMQLPVRTGLGRMERGIPSSLSIFSS